MKCKTIFYVYESVLAVVKGYNKILDSLSDEERLLFKPLTLVSLPRNQISTQRARRCT